MAVQLPFIMGFIVSPAGDNMNQKIKFKPLFYYDYIRTVVPSSSFF